MSCRLKFAFLLTLLPGILLPAWACAAGLPPEVRTTNNPAAAKAQIEQFIRGQVSSLVGDDPVAQQQARDGLVAETLQAGANQPEPSRLFLDAYAEVLNAELKPHTEHAAARVRLNIAILVARVAERAKNPQLMEATVALLDDPCEAVVLWAIKASRYLLGPVLANPGIARNNPLVPSLTQAVKTGSKSGAIVQVAYEALRIDLSGVPQANWDGIVRVLVDLAQGIMQIRLGEYRKGIPAMPTAEIPAVLLFTDPKLWPRQTAAQRLQSVQVMLELVSCAAQRWTTARMTDRADLALLINKIGEGLWVVGNYVGDQNIKRAAEGLTRVGPARAAAEVLAAVDEMYAALVKVGAFETLTKPSALPPPIAQPTDTPATSPSP